MESPGILGPIVGWGIVAPGLAAGIFMVLGVWLHHGGLGRWRPIEGFALWAAFATAYIGLIRWPAFPPVDATQSLIYLLFAVTLFAMVDLCWALGRMGAVGRFLLCLGAAVSLLAPRAEFAWTTSETALHMAAWSIGTFALWSFAAPGGSRAAELWNGLPMLVALIGESFILLMSGSAVLAQLCGAGAVALFVLTLLRPGARGAMPPSVAGPVLWLASMLALVGHTYAYLSGISLCFLAAALSVVGLGRLPPFSSWSPPKLWALQICLVIALCAGALEGSLADTSGY